MHATRDTTAVAICNGLGGRVMRGVRPLTYNEAMNVMKVESYEKWEPVEGVTTPVARALVEENHKGLVVTLLMSEMVGGIDSDLRINFGRVPAYTVYEEFVHPWNIYHTESPPMLHGTWESYCYPALVVKDSVWLDSFSDSQLLNYPDCIHYRLVTLDQTVDILCNRTPEASWVRPQSHV